MRNIILIWITFLSTSLYGQKNEIKICLNSSLFSFSGKSAEAYSQFNLFENSNFGYTNNPYGSNSEISYGILLNLQRVTKNKIIYGVNSGFQTNTSKVLIKSVFGYNGINPSNIEANGKSYLKNNSLCVFPFIGYRIIIDNINIDVNVGLNYDYILSAKENGYAEDSNSNKYYTSKDRKTIEYDISPKIQLSTEYKKFGLILGYSAGLVNYLQDYVGGSNNVYSRTINIGLTYRIIEKKALFIKF